MSTKFLIPLCATVALLAACSKHENNPPTNETATTPATPGPGETPPAGETPPPAEAPPPAETPPSGETQPPPPPPGN